MKKSIPIVGGAAAVALLLAAPGQAEVTAVGDSELASITGKMGHSPNQFDIGSSGTTTQSVTTGDSNIQWAWYQWHDEHGTDGSIKKGANDQSGTSSLVQASVVAETNLINWGAAASGQNTVGDAGSVDQLSVGAASFANGGF